MSLFMRRFPALAVFIAVLAAPLPHGSAAEPEPSQHEQWGLANIEGPAAWATAKGEGAVVAVVDTGVDKDHPELIGRLTGGASFYDCPAGAHVPCTDPEAWDDRNGHGTHVAGIVAAPLDGVGIAGVAPKAEIMPVRVLNATGHGTEADIATGIRWAVDNGAHVINLSLSVWKIANSQIVLGAAGLDEGVNAAWQHARAHGVLVVAAAGNDGKLSCNNEFTTNGGLCVGAVSQTDEHPSWSNWGAGVDLVAPGGGMATSGGPCEEEILSLWIVEADVDGCLGPQYAEIGGTSMASPHVAGVAALLYQLGLRGDAAADRILRTTDDVGPPGPDAHHAMGRLNARRAVENDTLVPPIPRS